MADRILIIRHGATEWSQNGKHTSTTDLPLLDVGREDAMAIGERLAGTKLDALITSPMQRARDTADIAFPGFNPEVNEGLHEWNYGDYEGVTTPEIRVGRPGWFLWRDGCPNGESPEEVGDRVDAVLADVAAREGTVALVAHGHILRVLTARYLGFPVEGGKAFELHTGTLSQLGWERDVPTVELWNCPVR